MSTGGLLIQVPLSSGDRVLHPFLDLFDFDLKLLPGTEVGPCRWRGRKTGEVREERKGREGGWRKVEGERRTLRRTLTPF